MILFFIYLALMGSFSQLISVLYTYDNNARGRENMLNAIQKCKCQRAVLLSAYEGLGIVVVFMLYSSQKKKWKLNITMFSLLDKSIQHELIHIYLKDWFNGYFVVHLAFLDTFNRKGSLMESHILLNHLFWQYLIYSVHPKGTKVIWGRFKI